MFGLDLGGGATAPGDVAARLEAVFAREAEALRRADFARLGGILDEKEALCALLADALPPPAAARRLRALAMRNATLLEAARAGLQAGAARVAALAAPPAPLLTYDGRGRLASLSGGTPGPARRS